MASRSSNESRPRSSRSTLRTWFSAIAALSAVIVFAAAPRRPAARPRADRGARAARDRAAAGAAARSRPARLGGTDAPRRPAQARSRAAAQGRGAEAARCATPRRSRPSSTATTERMDGAAETERPSAPELRARLVEIYKLGQARYLRLLLSTPDLRRIGQASRTVAALAKLDRDRVASHQQHARRARSGAGDARGARRRQLAALRAARREGAGRRRSARRRRATSSIRDIDRRRDLNAQLAGELQSAQQKLQATLRDMRGVPAGVPAAEAAALPLRPFRGDLDWPVDRRGAAPLRPPAGRRRRPTASRSRRPKARRPRHPRRRRRVCGHFCRIRQPGDPGSRIADLQPVRGSARHRRQEGRAGRARPAGRHRRADARRARPGCISSFASTVSRSIPYNG